MTTQTAVGIAPPPHLVPVLDAMRASDFAAALAAAEAALPGAEDRAPLLALAGLAAQRMGEPDKAIGHLRELLALNPTDNATRSNLAKALVETKELDEALAVAAGGQTPSLARIEGYVRQEQGDHAGAVAAYRRVLAQDPNDAASLNNLGNALGALGEFEDAIEAFERAITQSPREVELYLNLANVLRLADRSEPRLKVMRDAVALAPDNRFALTELALALAHHDKFDEALAQLEEVSRRFPEFGESQLELGRIYESYNRIDDLAELVARLAGPDTPPEAAFLDAWLAQRQGRFDDAARFAATIPESISPMRRFHLVGSIEERRGNAAAAFAAFDRMNRETLITAPATSRESYRTSIERKLAVWTPEWAARWTDHPPASHAHRDPIFLVGFPRSGTTLLDTMLMGLPALSVLEERPMVALAAHRQAQADIPTLSPEAIAKLREGYFAIARNYGWDDSKWLVDKQPLNMAHVPLIHRMFPEARFILAERHPYDVVLSCFMANFQLNFAMRSFTDLEEAARTYDAVFTAWDRSTRLLKIPFQTVRYERLVVDPTTELRPLVDWLGLDWTDDLVDHTDIAQSRGRVRTASYSQIGEPLYTRARYRWKGYAEQLAPVIPILEPWAKRLGYETE